jgi:tRNA(adenine34) deaminase
VPTDEECMRIALAEADVAAGEGEVPVGCVVVDADGDELSRAHNRRESLRDPTAHAEMLAIRPAAEHLRSWRLEGATLYVTLEPCPMCAGALLQARVARVVYGCDDPKAGALRSLFTLGEDPRLNHRFEVVPGVLGAECAARLTSFFSALRALGKK